MTQQETATKLAADHWGYIKKLMTTHLLPEAEIDVIGFHYRTAMIHGFKHGVEWERDRAETEAFFATETVDESAFELCPTCYDEAQCGGVMMPPSGVCLHHRPKPDTIGGVKDTTSTSLCHTCQRNKGCIGDYPRMKDGGCEGYLKAERESKPITYGGTPTEEFTPWIKASPKKWLCQTCDLVCSTVFIQTCEKTGVCAKYIPNLRERILDAKQEAPLSDMGCATTDCCNHSTTYLRNCAAYLPGAMRQCEKYTTEKQDTPTAAEQTAPYTAPAAKCKGLNFGLPPIMVKCNAEEAKGKFESEVKEWRQTEEGSMAEMIERWDCLQALRTFFERGGDVSWYQNESRLVMVNLAVWFADGRDVMEAKRLMLLKNAERDYYHPEVNAKIIASNGASFTP